MVKIQVATSNPGKLREYRVLAGENPIVIEPLPQFAGLPAFAEDAPTFAENSAGKALHYSRFTGELLIADDSGLVVPALGGAPGVHSARYAGPGASDEDRVRKLLAEMQDKSGEDRQARFVCVLTLAQQGRALAVFSDSAEGVIADGPRGTGGFGYDPVFYFPQLDKTYAEISREQKNEYSHRGRAFRKLLRYLLEPDSPELI
ncbi:MAG TPA: RdgB/HAM1 family non-canonical purine NTP pyrophosphatase [Candidatus Acidoferrales bacterium]|nr:RdgB/HAM1 family non-canonical purine NTP pyrophosphatase [Candidatus Acidoferrales bacterium]